MADIVQQTFERLFGPEFGHGKAFDLERLKRALKALGAPHRKLPAVIQVAGTNGKGSTIAFMRAIAEAAGPRVHSFTKPHLFQLSERFAVDGAVASDGALIQAAERVAAVSTELTQFDAQVAAAFLLFSESPADIVLLEAGMGGRDDSTNVIERPAASVITPIGLDHQDVLGSTLAEIAAHKAGILKPGAPAVIARQADEARDVIEAEAERVGAPLFRCGVEWDAYASHGRLVVQTASRALDLPLPALHGAHQVDNAGLACASLMLGEFTNAAPIADDAFADGVRNASLPARLQALTRGALSAPIRAMGGEVWVDGGHNVQALDALARWAVARQAIRRAPLIVIFNARARKDWGMAAKALAQTSELFIAAPMRDGVDPARISAHAAGEGATSIVASSLEAAMQNAAQFAAPRVLICGSFLLAAEALRLEGA